MTFLDALAGETGYNWFGDPAECDAAIREAMRAAADTLAERFGSDDPADWRRPEHKSVFTVIGAVQGEAIDMVNRATYQHAVAIGEGLERTGSAIADCSGDALPPSNSGHVSADELAAYATAARGEPERVDDQLELYANFEYKPHPITREQVESVTASTTTLRASPAAMDVPVELGRDLPATIVDLPGTAGTGTRDGDGGRPL